MSMVAEWGAKGERGVRRAAFQRGDIPLRDTVLWGLMNSAVEVMGRLWEFFVNLLKSYHWGKLVLQTSLETVRRAS